MRDVCRLICLALIGLFRSRASLQAEILTLRHQLNVLRRKSPQRLTFTSIDRLVFAGLYRLAPGVLDALKIVRPETVIRWHRAGFRAYWRWKSRPRNGRPKTPLEIRQLIRKMSLANPYFRNGSSASFRRFPRYVRFSPAGSTGRRNTGVKSLCWGFKCGPLGSLEHGASIIPL